MKTLYTDAGFNYHNTALVKEGGVVVGRICVSDGETFNKVESVGVGKVPVLKQYINIFETIALARAIEMAIAQGWIGNLQLFTDSEIAMFWARNGRIKEKSKTVVTDAHVSMFEYLHNARRNYAGVITFNYMPRDNNPAGKVLELELERDKEINHTTYERISPEYL
jgi:hypothetical protein